MHTKAVTVRGDDLLVSLTVLTTSQNTCIRSHHVVHLKYIGFKKIDKRKEKSMIILATVAYWWYEWL